MVEDLVTLLPASWRRYVEPMTGGGALFFYLRPRRALLADVNADLVTFYSIVRTNPGDLVGRLQRLRASRSRYYTLRSTKPKDIMERAVRFAYLNRLAWNGLYRVNRKGEFNVPIGDRLPKEMWNFEMFYKASEVLQGAKLVTGDFRQSEKYVKSGDFIYFDPPYPRGSREPSGFNRYSSEFFKDSDHRDLAALIQRITRRSIPVMVTIADVNHLDAIYPRGMRRTRIVSKALIACHGEARRKVKELILTNY